MSGLGSSRVSLTCRGVPRPPWGARLSRYCREVLAALGVEGWELSVLLCGDEVIRGLNARYRGKDTPTDVLSFRQDDGEGPSAGAAVGDLVISLPTVRRNAREHGVGEDEELRRVTVHGILHLAGMDHGRGKGRGMLGLQQKLLSSTGGRVIPGGKRGNQ
jgi:probable rRNA maturation factor